MFIYTYQIEQNPVNIQVSGSVFISHSWVWEPLRKFAKDCVDQLSIRLALRIYLFIDDVMS